MSGPGASAPGPMPDAEPPARDEEPDGRPDRQGPPGEGDRTHAASDPGVRTPPSETPYLCDICGQPMLDLHCKLVCEHCGFKRDCSDP